MKRFLQLSVLVFLVTISSSSFAYKKRCVITNFEFQPENLQTLSIGDTIVWTGNFINHTVTSDTVPAGAMHFGKSDGTKTDSLLHVVTHEGFYSFYCANHVNDANPDRRMRGRFTVVTNRVKNASSASGIKLEQNYPNPVSGETTIGFSLEKATDLSLSLYTSTGEFVKSLASGKYDGGKHSVLLDASLLSNGVYFYRLTAGGETLAGQMVVTK